MVRSRGASQSQVQVRNKARSKPWSGKNRLFFVGSGRSVWHWRSPQHRSKNGLLSSPGLSFGKPWRSEVEVHLKAKSRCEIRPGASPEAAKIVFFFYRFRPQRLTLKITPAQVSEVSPAAAQIVSFLAVPAATFDTEDHLSTGQKMGSFSSPGHAVSLFWRLRFGKPWRQAMLFPCPEGSVVGKSFQSEVEVRLKAKSRCEMRPEVSPEAAKIVSFLKVPAATFDTEDHPSTGQKMGSFSSPSHAVSLFWRLRFGKPWRQAMLFPCPEGSVVGKSFQSEVEVRLKAKSRCEMRPEVSPEAAKFVSFLKVPAATFDTEDHPSTGQKTSFLNSPGHAVALFWRLRFGKPCLFYRFRPQRLTLKITSAQVSEVSPAAAQIVSFLAVPAATFDIEDHPSTGRKTVSLSSPDHAVSLFRRQPFWEGFWVRSRGFAGRDTQTQPKVQTVHLQAKSWCELSPKAAKPPFFKDSGRDVWHWRSLQRRSKNGVIELARPCCFPVPEAAFLGRLLGQKSWFCRSWYPNATEGANGVFRRQLEVQIAPQSCKTFFFYRFRPQRLTLKITPAQVEKRCHWARQTMLFPCSGGSLFGKAFGSEVVVLPVVISKRNRRCQRCISKAIGGANCTPKLQNLLFL